MQATGLSRLDRFRGSMLGLAVGDALGTTLEFRKPGTFEPITDMVGGGPFDLQAGQWTDDTSMALCLLTSLLERDGFDARDQMERYCRWQTEGYLSSTGTCFDIGSTVASALDRFRETGQPLAGSSDPNSAGNGSLMRLAPVPIFFFPDLDAVERHAADSSRTTHAAAECVDACRLFARMLYRAFDHRSKDEVLFADAGSFGGAESIARIAGGEYRSKTVSEIRGSGYVVDCLEAALWCFWRASTFREAVLAAANLGLDADTTSAVCGQIAGAWFGASGIPSEWLDSLVLRDLIQSGVDRVGKFSDHSDPVEWEPST
jgi:ADP-ribosylglycohydrolase